MCVPICAESVCPKFPTLGPHPDYTNIYLLRKTLGIHRSSSPYLVYRRNTFTNFSLISTEWLPHCDSECCDPIRVSTSLPTGYTLLLEWSVTSAEKKQGPTSLLHQPRSKVLKPVVVQVILPRYVCVARCKHTCVTVAE